MPRENVDKSGKESRVLCSIQALRPYTSVHGGGLTAKSIARINEAALSPTLAVNRVVVSYKQKKLLRREIFPQVSGIAHVSCRSRAPRLDTSMHAVGLT